MLKQRLATAAVLLVALAALLFAAPASWFDAVLLLTLAAAAWEWGRLNTGSAALQWLCVGLTLLLSGLFWLLSSVAPSALWLVAAVLWLAAFGLALRGGVPRWARAPLGLRLLIGVTFLAFAWLAGVHWRAAGINALLSVLVLVWAADTGAYAAGRLYGRHKLAPNISPGKTWEGLAGGVLLVAVVALVWLGLDRHFAMDSASIYTRLQAGGPWGMALALAFLIAVSVCGDLFESLVKRSAGVKDASALLPGHGGILDRIDALLPVLPLAWLLAELTRGAAV